MEDLWHQAKFSNNVTFASFVNMLVLYSVLNVKS